jgi:arylformamidase
MATDGFLELEYATVSRVPDFGVIDARWTAAAQAALAAHPPEALAFGPHERQAVDLFRPAGPARALLVFIHGGYFQRRHRRDFAWVAPAWLGRGIAVANIGYRLCPEVDLATLIEDVAAGTQAALAAVADVPRVIGGHSAGGHLAATLAARVGGFAGCVPTSGVFELAPLLATSLNAALRLDLATADALSAMYLPAPRDLSVLACVGGAESSEFLRQSQGFARRWSVGGARAVSVEFPHLNHFTMQDEWAASSGPLVVGVMGMLAGVQPDGR